MPSMRGYAESTGIYGRDELPDICPTPTLTPAPRRKDGIFSPLMNAPNPADFPWQVRCPIRTAFIRRLLTVSSLDRTRAASQDWSGP